MPHLDALTLSLTSRGQSRFARPVAAATALISRWTDALRAPFHAPAKPRVRQEIEVRAIEERFGRASDLPDLERMERAYDRRDAGGTGAWDWR
jgi:hypothetical protein